MDQLVVRYRLKSGLSWSDGTPLTADDSLYSYEVAKALYPQARAELLDRTASYLAFDETTAEWRGIPGLRDPLYPENFFTPLPRHAWGEIPPAEINATGRVVYGYQLTVGETGTYRITFTSSAPLTSGIYRSRSTRSG